jgi:8-oxo-dGTP diphosphatase
MDIAILPRQKIVVAAFLVVDGKVLLARRPSWKSIAPGAWHLPGGHVEHGEHPAVALAREIREELDVAIEVLEPFFAFSYGRDVDHTVGIVHRVRLIDPPEQLRIATEDTEEVRWIGPDDLRIHLGPGDHNLEAAVRGFELVRVRA